MKKLFFLISIIVLFFLCLSCGNKGKTDDDSSAKLDKIILDYPSTAIVIRDAVTDIDGNHYDAVQIGDQIWMAENLRTTHYADGTEIPMENMWSWDDPYRYLQFEIEEKDKKDDKESKKRLNEEFLHTFGYYYNWEAVMHGANGSDKNPSGVMGICPSGWHVPSNAEWDELEAYNACELSGKINSWPGEWDKSDKAGTPGNIYDPKYNSTGFSALPGGAAWNYRLGESKYQKRGVYANFWTSTESKEDAYRSTAIARQLKYDKIPLSSESLDKIYGFSVRCVRNENESTVITITDAVTDIDGNSYDAVQIGEQVWMKENLRTTHYEDGTIIPLGGKTYSYSEPYRYIPGNSQNDEENMRNVSLYGYLYNWTAIMHGAESSWEKPSGVQGICPKGWHVPSDEEWIEMESHLTSGNVNEHFYRGDYAGKLTGGDKGTWEESNSACAPGNYNNPERNISGFSALPAGRSYGDDKSSFGKEAYFWSATSDLGDNAYDRYIVYNRAGVVRCSRKGAYNGYSVRCIRD